MDTTATSRKPNILVISVDDLGFNLVGFRANAANNSDVVTPSIDQLAGEGIVMDRFYATPWCAPSRGALQTGRWDVLIPWGPKNVWNWDPNARYVDLEGESRMRREGFSQRGGGDGGLQEFQGGAR